MPMHTRAELHDQIENLKLTNQDLYQLCLRALEVLISSRLLTGSVETQLISDLSNVIDTYEKKNYVVTSLPVASQGQSGCSVPSRKQIFYP